MKISKKYMAAFVLFFAAELFIGLFVRDKFVRPFIGDVLVVILLYLFLRVFYTPKTKLVPVYIFIVALLVELGQLFNVLKLIKLEHNNLAKIILGATFDIKDIICYLAGCLLLILWQEIECTHKK